MADEVHHHHGDDAPAAGEAVHLPGPSYLPVLTALGLTLGITGIVIWWPVVVIGASITIVVVWRWIRETREDISELPLGH
jgi:hypothetical protein